MYLLLKSHFLNERITLFVVIKEEISLQTEEENQITNAKETAHLFILF